jgi:hypothetical protein
MTKLLRDARKALDRSGLDYRMEESTRHVQIYIEGTMVLVVSRGKGREYGRLETLIRQAQQGKQVKNAVVRAAHEAGRSSSVNGGPRRGSHIAAAAPSLMGFISKGGHDGP